MHPGLSPKLLISSGHTNRTVTLCFYLCRLEMRCAPAFFLCLRQSRTEVGPAAPSFSPTAPRPKESPKLDQARPESARAQGPGPRKGAWVGAVQEAERRLQAPPPPSRRQHAAPPGSAPSRLPSACRAHAWGGMEAAPRPPRCLRRCLTTRTPQSSTTLPSFFSHQPREDPKALPLVFTPLSGSGKNVSLPHTPLYSQDHNEFATQSLPFLSTSSTLGHL